MLIAYAPSDGAVVWTSGTNTVTPLGPPDEVAAVLTGRDDLLLIRLHDVEDADLVAQLLRFPARVLNGRVIIREPAPGTPTPDPPAPSTPTTAEMLRMILDLQTQSQRLQDQSDQLTLLIGGGL